MPTFLWLDEDEVSDTYATIRFRLFLSLSLSRDVYSEIMNTMNKFKLKSNDFGLK